MTSANQHPASLSEMIDALPPQTGKTNLTGKLLAIHRHSRSIAERRRIINNWDRRAEAREGCVWNGAEFVEAATDGELAAEAADRRYDEIKHGDL